MKKSVKIAYHVGPHRDEIDNTVKEQVSGAITYDVDVPDGMDLCLKDVLMKAFEKLNNVKGKIFIGYFTMYVDDKISNDAAILSIVKGKPKIEIGEGKE